MGETFDIVSYLVTVCPAMGILGWWIKELKADNKELKADNKRLNDVVIELSRDQIKVNTEWKLIHELKNK